MQPFTLFGQCLNPDRVVKQIMKYTGCCRETAEDMLQDALEDILNGKTTLSEKGNVETNLVRVAGKKRTKYRQPFKKGRICGEGEAHQLRPIERDPVYSEVLEARTKAVWHIFEHMPPRYTQLLVRLYNEGESFATIAKKDKRSVRAIYLKAARAEECFKKKAYELGYDNADLKYVDTRTRTIAQSKYVSTLSDDSFGGSTSPGLLGDSM